MVLIDEINRAPAKVQSALLEAMQEHQVTIGDDTFKLDQPFLVMATQNPIEQEGTYPLPEAQMDRFIMHVMIDYPDDASELAIMRLNRREQGKGYVRERIPRRVGERVGIEGCVEREEPKNGWYDI